MRFRVQFIQSNMYGNWDSDALIHRHEAVGDSPFAAALDLHRRFIAANIDRNKDRQLVMESITSDDASPDQIREFETLFLRYYWTGWWKAKWRGETEFIKGERRSD